MAMTERPATLVLSGGGAKGGFQAGAERILREVHGFQWERIFGVSVGALNAALLAQRAYRELNEIWLNIRAEDVYRKFSWPVVALRLGLFRKLGLYDNSPLRDLIYKYAAGRPFAVPAHVGRVSLVSGSYEVVPHDARDFLDAVWQSANLPVIWEPIGRQAIVDGGLRNVTPLGDALQFEPSEIVVISCNSPKLDPVKPPATILDVASRALADITMSEILLNDVDTFVRINELVRQAYEAGVELRKPDGTPYRYCRITIIEPTVPLGDTLDFSPELMRSRMRHGEERARVAVGPAGEGPEEHLPQRKVKAYEPPPIHA